MQKSRQELNRRVSIAGYDGLYTRANKILLKISIDGKTKYQSTGLTLSKPNIKAAVLKLATIEQQQAQGVFDFEAHFPSAKQSRTNAKERAARENNYSVKHVATQWYTNWLRNNPAAATSTKGDHEKIIRCHIDKMGHLDMKSIKMKDLITWYESLVNMKTGEALSQKRLDNVNSTTGQIFNYAHSRGYFEANPWTQFKAWDNVEHASKKRAATIDSPVNPDTPLNKNEINAILFNGHKHVDQCIVNMIGFNLAMGLRVGELFAVCWENIDMKDKTITIDQQFTGRELKLPKHGLTRKLALTDTAIKYLEKQKANTFFNQPLTHDYIYKKSNELVIEKRSQRFVFPMPNSDRPFPDSSYFITIWYELLKSVGVDIVTQSGDTRKPYTMRHSFASRLFTNGGSIEFVAATLGNTAKVCARNYARIIPEEQQFDHELKNMLLEGK